MGAGPGALCRCQPSDPLLPAHARPTNTNSGTSSRNRSLAARGRHPTPLAPAHAGCWSACLVGVHARAWRGQTACQRMRRRSDAAPGPRHQPAHPRLHLARPCDGALTRRAARNRRACTCSAQAGVRGSRPATLPDQSPQKPLPWARARSAPLPSPTTAGGRGKEQGL